jgi:hypothetical protein
MLDDFSTESYVSALKRLEDLGNIGEKCRETAQREFDLEKVGGERYRRLYRKLLENG